MKKPSKTRSTQSSAANTFSGSERPERDVAQQSFDHAQAYYAPLLNERLLTQTPLINYIHYLADNDDRVYVNPDPRISLRPLVIQKSSTDPKAWMPINERILLDIAASDEANASAGTKPKSIFAYPVRISENHWTLVLVDREKATIEYYDSLQNYGDKHTNAAGIHSHFQQFAKELSNKEGGKPYTFEPKIKTHLQKDTFQCGAWTLYFLENRLKNSNVDFNKLGTSSTPLPDMAAYRNLMVKKLSLAETAKSLLSGPSNEPNQHQKSLSMKSPEIIPTTPAASPSSRPSANAGTRTIPMSAMGTPLKIRPSSPLQSSANTFSSSERAESAIAQKSFDNAQAYYAPLFNKRVLTQVPLSNYIQYLADNDDRLYVNPDPRISLRPLVIQKSSTDPEASMPINERILLDIAASDEANASAGTKPKSIFAYPVQITENHWTLVLVDREKRTIEYYGSPQNYGNKNTDIAGAAGIDAHFKKFAKELSDKEGGKPYTFEPKIKTHLQKDTFQDGASALYFLENRLKDSNVDFNKLGTPGAPLPDMAAYRKLMVKKLSLAETAKSILTDSSNKKPSP